MHDRVLKHPERVQNLYFTFVFVLRAMKKVSTITTLEKSSIFISFFFLTNDCLCVLYVLQTAPYLEETEYDTGNHLEDLKAHSLIRQLVHNPKLQAACPLPFDEAKLWQGQSGPE
jgi:ERO1-like protein alpha